MTINQIKTLFSNVASAHYMLNDFEFGELWEIEEKMNKNAKYPMLFVSPISSITGEQVKERTFQVLVMDLVKKDGTETVDAWSDTEQILDDVIKIVRRESDSYELVGEPTLFPFKEEYSDWCTGYRAELVIRTDFNSNYCDIPSDSFVSPESVDQVVTIKDQNGNVLATLKGGQSYEVTVFSALKDTLTANVTTITNQL